MERVRREERVFRARMPRSSRPSPRPLFLFLQGDAAFFPCRERDTRERAALREPLRERASSESERQPPPSRQREAQERGKEMRDDIPERERREIASRPPVAVTPRRARCLPPEAFFATRL